MEKQKQKWSRGTYERVAEHAWRYYLFNQSPRADMTDASAAAWKACNAVWTVLTIDERSAVYMYHTARISLYPSRQAKAEACAERCGTDTQTIWTMLDRCWRLWAVERGLVDE